MARQTRSERRARRAQTERRPAPLTPAPAGVVDGGGQPPRTPVAHGRSGGSGDRRPAAETHSHQPRFFRFVRESWAELQKVEWPGQRQVIAGTTVVLIACIVVGAYLWANDIVWKHFVQNVLLK
jgi:preprotein translocase SecE subunit